MGGSDRIAAVIRGKIAELGYTSRYVAERAGIPAQNLSASLVGRRKIPAAEFLKLCEILGLQFEDFKEKVRTEP